MEREQIDWLTREGRRKPSLTGAACRDDGSRQRVVATNRGCHLVSGDPMRQGESLELTIPSMGIVKVQVRWSDRSSAGVRFVEGSAAEQRRALLGF